jgi:hypothetical protein
MNSIQQTSTPWPSLRVTYTLLCIILVLMAVSIVSLLSIDDKVLLKQLIEDSGPVQLVGQTCIALAFALCLFYVLVDKQRRGSYIPLSYILMFYTLREADYHYKVSEYAKPTQIKRFYSHELIPLSTKLFMAAITILLLVVLYRYFKQEKQGFLTALKYRLPWAIFVFVWGVVAVMSQVVDQVPLFHTVDGQVFEEVFESSAEVMALIAVILFRFQVRESMQSSGA